MAVYIKSISIRVRAHIYAPYKVVCEKESIQEFILEGEIDNFVYRKLKKKTKLPLNWGHLRSKDITDKRCESRITYLFINAEQVQAEVAVWYYKEIPF